MKRQAYDIAIIGGGVIGAAIARELSKYNVKVCLFEKEEELAFGISKSNSGIIHPGTQNPPGSLKGRLCVEGNRQIRKIAYELGVDFKEIGELIVAFGEKDLAKLRRLKQDADILKVPGTRIVDRSWLRKKEPNLSKRVKYALYAPSAGIISPYRLVYDLSENAAINGVSIFTGTEISSISKISKDEGSPLFELTALKRTFRSRYVINAAGLYADKVSRMVDVDDFEIKPRKGEEFLLDKKRAHLVNHLIFPLPTKTSKGVLVIKTADGNPMIGPTANDIEDKTDLSTSDEGLKKVLSSVKKMVPAISGRDIIAYFAGLRPVAGNDFIVRYEDEVPGFINVAGIQSPGLTAAAAIALMVIKLLRDHGLRLKKKGMFHRHRPKSIHLFDMPLSKTKRLIKKDPSYADIVCRCEMVSAKEIRDAIDRGARTLDGIKFRTRAQAGRCHGGFCTARIMKILSEERKIPITGVTKRGKGSWMVKEDKSE